MNACNSTKTNLRVLFLVVCGCGDAISQTENQRSVSFSSPVISVVTSANGKQIYAGSGNTISVFDFHLELKKIVRSELDFVHDLKLADDQLIASGGSPAEHGMIEVYDVKSLKILRRKLIHNDVIQSIALMPNQLFTAGTDGKIKCIKLRPFDVERDYDHHSRRVTAIEHLAGTELMISGGLDDTLRVWNPQKSKALRTLTHHQDDILDIASRGNLEKPPMLASVSRDKTVRFWQPTIGRMVRFKKLDEVPTVCLWIPGTNKLVVGTEAGRLFAVRSADLQTKLLFECKERICSLCLIDESTLGVGTHRALKSITIDP